MSGRPRNAGTEPSDGIIAARPLGQSHHENGRHGRHCAAGSMPREMVCSRVTQRMAVNAHVDCGTKQVAVEIR